MFNVGQVLTIFVFYYTINNKIRSICGFITKWLLMDSAGIKCLFINGWEEKLLEKAEYRNSIRSRRLICDALLELLSEKPLERITVTDIAKRADVNRGTFYLHYDNVNDVIDELQETLITQMDQYFDDKDIPFTTDNIMILTAECLKYVYDQDQTKYVPLLFHQQLNFADKVCKRFQKRVFSSKESPGDEDSRRELIVRATFLVHGVIGVFNASESGILDASPEQLIRSLDRLVTDMR